jgi:outer membrane protein
MKPSNLLLAALVVLAATVAGAQQGEWSVGMRVMPVTADLTSETVAATNSAVSFDSGFGLGADVGYLLTDHLGLEASLSAALHSMTVEGGLFDGRDAGSQWVVPATVTMVYHLPLSGRYQPYLGAGAAYVGFVGYSRSNEMTAIGVEDIDTKGSVGLVLQAGLDVELSDRWSVVLDLKHLDVAADTEVILDLNRTYATVPLDGDVWQIGLGFEHRFGYRH